VIIEINQENKKVHLVGPYYANNFSLYHIFMTGSGAHPNAYSKIIAGIYRKVKQLGYRSPQKIPSHMKMFLTI